MRIYFAFLLISAATAFPQKQSEPALSVLKGVVKSPDGTPLAGVRVKAVRIKPDLWSGLPVDSASDGGFTLDGLADGTYLLCGSTKPRFMLADPCAARGTNPKGQIEVKSGTRIPSQIVEMGNGALLRIRVKDRDRLLQEKLNSEATAPQNRQIRSLSVFAWLPGNPVPQRLLANGGGPDEVVYELVVPSRLASVRILAEPIGPALMEDGSSVSGPGGKIDRTLAVPASKRSVVELVLSTGRPQK